MPEKGWFNTAGRPGDRDLSDQLKGLDWLLDYCLGRTVLDVGCAEGLISIELARHGARAVHGVDIRADHVAVGNGLRGNLAVTLEVADANDWRPRRAYDVVIGLAVLHKLRNPTEVAAWMAATAREAVVLRLPPAHAPTVIDSRSGGNPHHIGDVMLHAGFHLHSSSYDGHFGEWVGVYLRNA